MTRRQIASQILTAMIDSEGTKEEKVRAAVEYTDMLLIELIKVRGRRPNVKEGMIPNAERNQTEVSQLPRERKPAQAHRTARS